MRTGIATGLLAALLALVIAGAALADRETAQFSAGRGDKALAAKKWDEAEELYRKALEEDETFLPAHYGLAQALVGGGKSATAVEELRKFVEAATKETALPAEWKPILAKAQKQLGELDAAGGALQKILDGYADALVDLAQRWMTKDPQTAERSLRRALKIKPGSAKAAQLLEKLGKSAGDVIEMFDGKSVKGWDGADPPMWQITDGTLVGACRDSAYGIRTDRKFEGEFTFRVEAKVLEEYAQPVFFALMPCWKGSDDHYSFGVLRGKITLIDDTGPGKSREVISLSPPELKKPFDPMQWNTYEVRCKGSEVTAFINGDQVGREERPEWRAGGFVGLKVQNVKAAFRKVEVEVK